MDLKINYTVMCALKKTNGNKPTYLNISIRKFKHAKNSRLVNTNKTLLLICCCLFIIKQSQNNADKHLLRLVSNV